MKMKVLTILSIMAVTTSAHGMLQANAGNLLARASRQMIAKQIGKRMYSNGTTEAQQITSKNCSDCSAKLKNQSKADKFILYSSYVSVFCAGSSVAFAVTSLTK